MTGTIPPKRSSAAAPACGYSPLHLQTFLTAHLAKALPGRILQLRALPRTPTGKIDRKALQAQAEAEETAHDG